jgi:hypothetical protein
VRGFEKRDGAVPALPALGVLAIGGSLAVGASVALRRKRE